MIVVDETRSCRCAFRHRPLRLHDQHWARRDPQRTRVGCNDQGNNLLPSTPPARTPLPISRQNLELQTKISAYAQRSTLPRIGTRREASGSIGTRREASAHIGTRRHASARFDIISTHFDRPTQLHSASLLSHFSAHNDSPTSSQQGPPATRPFLFLRPPPAPVHAPKKSVTHPAKLKPWPCPWAHPGPAPEPTPGLPLGPTPACPWALGSTGQGCGGFRVGWEQGRWLDLTG